MIKRLLGITITGLFLLCLGTIGVFAGLKEADELFRAGKYAEAEAEYRAILPELKGAEASHAQFRIGYLLFNQGKYDEVITEFKKVADIPGAHPHHISDAQLHIGHLLYTQRKYDEAITEFKKVADIPGAHPYHISDAQLYIGHSLYNQRKYDEAITEFKKVADIPDASPYHISDAQLYIGHSLYNQRKYDEAQNAYIEVLFITNALKEHLKQALFKIDFTKMTIEEADQILVKAYRVQTNKMKYADYLSLLVSNMSLETQKKFTEK